MTTGRGRPPRRELRVAFLGAGASRAAGLPLTSELLARIYPVSGKATWSTIQSSAAWRRSLQSAIRVLYADGDAPGFRPPVTEFFTMLETVARTHDQLPRLPLDAGALLRSLKREIATGLLTDAKALKPAGLPHQDLLQGADRPHVVITSNWDTLIEAAASSLGIRVHFSWPLDANGRRRNLQRAGELVVLKLHGSVDWGLAVDRVYSATPGLRYTDLSTPLGGKTSFARGSMRRERVLRYRQINDPHALGFVVPLIATMAVGKSSSIDHLRLQWTDAHYALSRASRLDFLGYSFPIDDLELGALFRIATRAPGKSGVDERLRLSVRDRGREPHQRAKALLGPEIEDNYIPM